MTLGEAYLELVLRYAQVGPKGDVDSYSGPPELRERVEREPSPSAAEVADEARSLAAQVASDPDAARRRWLTAQLAGIEAASRKLAGESIPFRELVKRCYDVEPQLVPDEVLAEAHAELDSVLAGSGDVRDRTCAWLDTQLVPPDRVAPALEELTGHLRDWARDAIGLPDGEALSLSTTGGERWIGLAEYEGDLRTRIVVNTDVPMWSYRLAEFVTHEIYPGHHTENVLKEVELISGRGYAELAVFAAPAQKAFLTEGVADAGFDAAFGTEPDVASAELVRPLGIPYDSEVAAAVRHAKRVLENLGVNARILLDEGRLSVEDLRPYLRRWMFEDDDYVDRLARSVEDFPWHPYAVSNALARPVCSAWVAGDAGRLRRLLAEQLTTADLVT